MSQRRGTNPYVNTTTQRNEQNLVESLIVESIKLHGVEMYYVPREVVAEDRLFGEDPISAFTEFFPIECYCETVDGFEGDGDFISKFGIEIRDIATFVVSRRRFQEETQMVRPREGDLLYFPISRGLFEIKFVEHEKPFYMLGKNYTFSLNCELFKFSEETIETGAPEIDTLMDRIEYTQYFVVSLTGGYTGVMFNVGDEVYQNTTSATPTGPTTSTGYNGVVVGVTGNNGSTAAVQVINVIGKWKKSSSSTTYYITKANNSSYYKVLDIFDSVDIAPDSNNRDLDILGDSGIVDFSETNPFGEV